MIISDLRRRVLRQHLVELDDVRIIFREFIRSAVAAKDNVFHRAPSQYSEIQVLPNLSI